MRLPYHNRKDVYAGLLMMAIGIFAALYATHYRAGTLNRMGPGFMPTWLGIIMGVLGFVVTVKAMVTAQEGEQQWQLPNPRASICIIGGVLAFILFGEYLGLALATFALVFISALGDRTQTFKSALVLAVAVTVFGVALFSFGLQLSFPLYPWG